MRTLRLKVSNQVFDKLIWLLSKFGKDEVEILNEDSDFVENQKYLNEESKRIELIQELEKGEKSGFVEDFNKTTFLKNLHEKHQAE